MCFLLIFAKVKQNHIQEEHPEYSTKCSKSIKVGVNYSFKTSIHNEFIQNELFKIRERIYANDERKTAPKLQ